MNQLRRQPSSKKEREKTTAMAFRACTPFIGPRGKRGKGGHAIQSTRRKNGEKRCICPIITRAEEKKGNSRPCFGSSGGGGGKGKGGTLTESSPPATMKNLGEKGPYCISTPVGEEGKKGKKNKELALPSSSVLAGGGGGRGEGKVGRLHSGMASLGRGRGGK